MKIVFCGPPHSGKSVFLANLIEKLPTDSHTIIRACPDGEGNWSNNSNQSETSLVRKKGKFTKSFIEDRCQTIDNQINKIVLVDVGGIMSKENEQVFKHCDSFVVLSNDEKEKKEWIEFGENLGLECIGALDSKLEGQEEIYDREPYLQGKIVGLDRGNNLKNSQIINAMASDIVQKSKYSEKTINTDEEFSGKIIDDTELGFELGYGKEILTEDGTPIKKVKWKENAISKVYQAIEKKLDSKQPVRINGIRANFILSAICKAARKQGVKDISTYDTRLKQYIPIKNLPKKRGMKQANGLEYHLIENKENIFMDIDIMDEQYSLEDYQKCVIPKIKEEKNLYLSGRIPLWLLASISSSYNSNRIYTFQPGKGFTCIASKNEKELGTIVDGAEGIDINQYFKDKREKTTTKLPSLEQKQGILYRVKNFLANRKHETKYLDQTIQNKTIPSVNDSNNTSNNEFKSNIKTNMKENALAEHISINNNNKDLKSERAS